jgi:DNA repair photolyase
MLYKTGVEYGDYTMNHVLGCAHGCVYPCYAYTMAKRFGKVKTHKDWCEPKLVSNTLQLLDTEIPRLADKIKSVQLCFSTDPFMLGYNDVEEMSLQAIRKLNDAGIPCNILTKGILPNALTPLMPENEYGITLVSLDEDFREKYEPSAATIKRRLKALLNLHEQGCRTWVSIEPYPTPNIINQDIHALLDALFFVDRIIFGRMNYNESVTGYKERKIFYNQQAAIVVEFCKEHNIQCHIKNGTITE